MDANATHDEGQVSPGSRTTNLFGWRFLLPLMLGTTLNPINSSMIATGLAGIAVDFRTGPGRAASLVSVLYLCSAVMQPTMGKLSVLFGPRRVFVVGVSILIVGGALGGLAPNFGALLVSRALIGVGTSACYPTAMAMVRRRADSGGVSVPSRVLGNFSIASQIVVVFGLPLGGVLAGAFGWRALFWVNVPLAAVALTSALLAVDPDPVTDRRAGMGAVAAIDLPGIGLFAGAIVCLLVFLAGMSRPQWGLLACSIILTLILIAWEGHAQEPLIDVRMLASHAPLQRTYVRQTLIGLGVYTALYASSQWLESAAGYSSVRVGLVLLPLSGVSIIAARIASNRGWTRWPLVFGALALMGGGLTMLAMTSGSSLLIVIGMSVLFGITNGLTGFANQATLYRQTLGGTIAIAAGLFRTFGYIGAIFSSSIIGLAFGDHVTDAGFHSLGWVVAGIGAASLALTVFDRAIPVTVAA